MSDQFNDDQFTFKAWLQETSPGGPFKLHVQGEVHVKDASLLYQLDKKEPQGYFKEELFLIIKPDPSPGDTLISIKYHEDLQDRSTYKKVTIVTRTDQVFESGDLETKID